MTYVQKPVRVLTTPFGAVRAIFTTGKHVHISTEDDAPLMLRGKPYRVSLGLVADDGVTWTTGDRTFYISVTRQDVYGKEAPPSHRAMIIGACIAAVSTFIGDGGADVLREAEYVDANNDVDRLQAKIDEMNVEIRALQVDLSHARARMRRNEARTNA